jgi:hypothetical protein
MQTGGAGAQRQGLQAFAQIGGHFFFEIVAVEAQRGDPVPVEGLFDEDQLFAVGSGDGKGDPFLHDASSLSQPRSRQFINNHLILTWDDILFKWKFEDVFP